MKRRHLAPLGLLASSAFHERLIADIAIDPLEIVPSESQPDSPAQSWTTIAGTGLLICAFIAMLIVRMKQARQSKPENSTGSRGESDKI